jgi:hypothetical protein
MKYTILSLIFLLFLSIPVHSQKKKQKDKASESIVLDTVQRNKDEELTLLNQDFQYNDPTKYRIFPEVNSRVKYTEIIEVEGGVKKEKLFEAIRKWFSDTYVSSKAVLEISDKETGELSGKGSMTVFYKMPIVVGRDVNITYSISVWVKDGKYKYEIKNIFGKYYTVDNSYTEFEINNYKAKSNNRNEEEFKNNVNVRIVALTQNLKNYITRFLIQNNDW